MADAATRDRDVFLAFERALDERVCDQVLPREWGRVVLTPSAPLIWDASWVELERVGLSPAEATAIADAELGGAGLAHRTVAALDQADGRRLAEELETSSEFPGWTVERTRYMAWRGGKGAAPSSVSSQLVPDSGTNCERTGAGRSEVAVREAGLAEIEGLRRALLEEETPGPTRDRAATIEQLLELDRRYGEAGGDRWFAAPAAGEPLSCCRLLRHGGIAQVEDVGTRAAARERGYAKAIVLAAVAAAQAAGDARIFLTADAADWPQAIYAGLGFEPVGDLTILRRPP
jgi:GNAT superfamily N-acetyltransferase